MEDPQITVSAAESRARQVTREVFDWYERLGQENYRDQPVTQLEHSTQCALAAQRDGQPPQVVLAAFLHDIGQLVHAHPDDDKDIGALFHDKLGADYLHSLGVPEEVICIARGHAEVNRYLCRTQHGYYEELGDVGQRALELQGGMMTPSEAEEFEKNPHFSVVMSGRVWDEAAHVPNMPDLPPLSEYRDMFYDYMLDVFKAQTAKI